MPSPPALRSRGRHPRRAAGLLVALLVLSTVPALLAGCARAPAEPSGPWNVVVLLVDTLRADRLPFHGYPRDTAPTLAALAGESVVFERARAQAGCTFPSVVSLLTSRPASEIMAGIDRHGMAVPEGLPYLPAILRERGWATAAVSASIVVRDTPSQINHQGGYGRGFDVFDESCLERSAACVNARAVPLLDELPEPFFLYLHYLDPHAPYRPPSWHERRFARSRPERRWVRRGDPGPLFRTLYEGEPGGEIERAELRHLRDLYDEEILFFDRQLAQLQAELRDRDLLER
ncbi:MAG TPA: sulfatase-like hydrolase/transferase, partial [Thermoanaerobaculia bacterium]|nr:sulfatase-like hydrolase/transferase [Thermoanaerobaculia bacterium]